MITLLCAMLVDPAAASPRGFQVLFHDKTGTVTGDVAIDITSAGMAPLTGTLHNDGKPPDIAANDSTWSSSFSDTPDSQFRVEVSGSGVDLTVDVPTSLLATIPRLVLTSDGTTLSATNSETNRPPPAATSTTTQGQPGQMGAQGLMGAGAGPARRRTVRPDGRARPDGPGPGWAVRAATGRSGAR